MKYDKTVSTTETNDKLSSQVTNERWTFTTEEVIEALKAKYKISALWVTFDKIYPEMEMNGHYYIPKRDGEFYLIKESKFTP